MWTVDRGVPASGKRISPAGLSGAEEELLSLTIQIETPENVPLSVRLAGPAHRGGAWLLDYFIRWTGSLVLLFLLACMGQASGLGGTFGGLALVTLFLVQWAYYVISEGFYNGQSPGKRAFGLRVIQENGAPVTFWPALLRNLLRVSDVLPLAVIWLGELEAINALTLQLVPIYGIALVSMVCTRRMQRVGDVLARTMVIHEGHAEQPKVPPILSRISPLSSEVIGSWRPAPRTLALIDEFLSRRHVLSHKRGHALAAVLARDLALRLNYRGDLERVQRFPMGFLASVSVTFGSEKDEPVVRATEAGQ
ncbi:MAG: RDD family protein [Planctomycetaceae bacterium]|nr:RDD family protein [Planctomycetaceae bacterium]